MRYDYNMIVIGAGSGGLVASYIASALKARVALIEKNRMGGDCLNTGCVPSKALIAAAKTAHVMRTARKFGIHPVEPEIDFSNVMAQLHDTIATVAPHDSVERYTSLGVDCFSGSAMLKDSHHVEVNGQILSSRSIILATGAEAAIPDIKGLQDVHYVTSDTLWELTTLPKRLLVVGSGPIGCELAMALNRLGSEVTQLSRSDRILPREDADIASIAQTQMQQEGITQHFGATLEHFSHDGESLAHYTLSGHTHTCAFDVVLLAVGRKARISGYGLEALNIKFDKHGFIEHNAFLQTSDPDIFVCGDISGSYQFTHYAAHQAYYATINALFGFLYKSKLRDNVMPWVTFTSPEIARVGLNEQDATARNIAYDLTEYDISDLDRAITERHTTGKVKILTRKGKDTLLGVTIIADHAGDMLTEFTLAMQHGLGLNAILRTIHPYPTWAEANKHAAGAWKRANAPAWVMPWLARFHGWQRG